MPIIAVTRLELVNANLMYLVDDNTNYRKKAGMNNGHYHVVSEMYYWHSTEHAATVCLLAGIGRILKDTDIDITSA